MKRVMICALAIAAACAPAFGQAVGTAWYDPLEYFGYVPSSMPNYVSNGLVSDEVDALFRSPKDLSLYTGYSIYTAYGNYASVIGATNWINPFASAVPNYGDEIGAYQASATFPFLGYRAGAMIGHVHTVSGNISGGYITDADSSTVDTDANIIGTIDYTTTSSYSATARYSGSNNAGLVGLSLGDIGVSMLIYQYGTARKLGGSKSYSWSEGSDADYLLTLPGSDLIADEDLYVGYGSDGVEAAYGGSGTIGGALVGQYALGTWPLIARLGMSGGNNGLSLSNVKTDYSQRVLYASTAGAAATATDINTYSMSYGTSRSAAWTLSGAFPAWAAEPGTAYIDPSTSKDTFFDIDLAVGAEPEFTLNESLSFRTRGMLEVTSDNDSDAMTYAASSSFEKATTAAADDTWEYAYSSSTASRTNDLGFGLELGGLAVLKDSTGFITLGAGFFAKPSYGFGSTVHSAGSTIVTRSYVDSVNDNPITEAAAQAAASLDDAAALIGEAGTYEGSSTDSTATTYLGSDTSSTFGLELNLPTSVVMSFAEGRISAIFGYTVKLSSTLTTSRQTASTAVRTVTLNDGSADVFTGTSETVTDGSYSTASSSTWSGQMGWCLRWAPNPAMTFDISGESILAALDGIGFDDFMIDDFLGTLAISATFRF